MNENTCTIVQNKRIHVYGLISVMVENSSNYLFGASVVNSKMMSIFVLNDMHVEGDADDHIVSVDVFRFGWGCASFTSAEALVSLCRVSCNIF